MLLVQTSGGLSRQWAAGIATRSATTRLAPPATGPVHTLFGRRAVAAAGSADAMGMKRGLRCARQNGRPHEHAHPLRGDGSGAVRRAAAAVPLMYCPPPALLTLCCASSRAEEQHLDSKDIPECPPALGCRRRCLEAARRLCRQQCTVSPAAAPWRCTPAPPAAPAPTARCTAALRKQKEEISTCAKRFHRTKMIRRLLH